MRKTSWFVSVLLVAVLPVALSAHLKLTKSFPTEGSTISAAPKQLQLWFNEEPLLPLSSITLKGPDGNVKIDAPRVSSDHSITVAVGNALTPGAYRIAWKAAGDDGHVVTGTVDFTVKDAARPPM